MNRLLCRIFSIESGVSFWLAMSMGGCSMPLLAAPQTAQELVSAFAARSKGNLPVPADVQSAYAAKLQQSLRDAKLADLPSQYILLVDRNRHVQTLFIYWKTPQGAWQFVWAAPVSTGRTGRFDHYLTPLGVFEHSLANHDYRAEGTRNDAGIRGYGSKGMRVYDFGWATSERGWGTGAPGIMRLQMHATDPGLESRLGKPASKGCVRISSELNRLIDHYGLIDADYDAAAKKGKPLWILRPDREQVATPGRYMVVVDSALKARPAWLPVPVAAPTRNAAKPASPP